MNNPEAFFTVDDFADVRTGDKGDTLILSVFPRTTAEYEFLEEKLSVDRVAEHFAPLLTGQPQRTLLPQLPGIVYLLPGVLGGGVTGSPSLDGHGKSLSYHLLSLKLEK